MKGAAIICSQGKTVKVLSTCFLACLPYVMSGHDGENDIDGTSPGVELQPSHGEGDLAGASAPEPAANSVEDALSAAWSSESDGMSVPIVAPEDAPSFASTRAPGQPSTGGHERDPHGRARRRDRQLPSMCGCRCRQVARGHLGPRGPAAKRCACPMCGHSSTENGHGCHFRVLVSPQTRGAVLCEHCCDFCLQLLRWGDSYHDMGRAWQNW